MSGSILDLGQGMYFIQRGWLNGNHFAFVDEQTILVDTGYLGGRDETLALLARCGVAAKQVDLIVTTHVHCDHVGANAHIHRASGCPIALHPESRRITEAQDGRANWSDYYAQQYEYFPCHQDLNHGDEIRMGGLDWQVIHTPGHASGMICLWAPERRWLISADAIWDGDFGVLTCLVEGEDAPQVHLASVQRLAKLKPRRIFPGHGLVIDDPELALERCLARARAFAEDPQRVGEDQMRKILLYHLLMHSPIPRKQLMASLRQAPWFGETCEHYFPDEGVGALHRFLDDLIARNLVEEGLGGIRTVLIA